MTEPRELIHRLTDWTALDRVAAPVRDAVQKVLRPGAVKDALHGVWLGHALHPALAQLPVGLFTGAAALDATGHRGSAPARLIGLGVLASVPAALTGLADYADGHEEHQRVGVVHAALNSVAIGAYLASLRLRSRGRQAPGLGLGLTGYLLVLTSAVLGGELTTRHGLGVNHAADVAHTGPEDWFDLGPLTDFAAEHPVGRQAGLVPVVVVNSAERLVVLADRCGHLAAPLHQGELTTVDGARCLRCPWHGSAFRLADGTVARGPATAPQPVLDTDVRDGRLRVKVRTYPGVPAS